MSALDGEYQIAIRSPHWSRLREYVLWLVDGRCEHCGIHVPPAELDLHHLTYERLGHEVLGDVELLCKPCHRTADVQREQATAGRRWQARLDGWATKVYGEDWEYERDAESVAEDFAVWLEDTV